MDVVLRLEVRHPVGDLLGDADQRRQLHAAALGTCEGRRAVNRRRRTGNVNSGHRSRPAARHSSGSGSFMPRPLEPGKDGGR